MKAYLTNLAQARRAATAGFAVSGMLALMKIIAGVAANSHGMIADGVESAGDSVTALVVLFGLVQAAEPPDDEHPYGHTRAEDLAGKTVATLMLASGVVLLNSNLWGVYEDYRAGVHPTTPHVWTLWLMGISLVIKAGLFAYKFHVGRKLRSLALRADAWNDFTDVLSAIAVIIGLFMARGGFVWADRASAIVVSLMIIYTAYAVSKAASAALLDQQAPPETLKELRELALSVPGVSGVEKLLARRSGLMFFVDMHLEVEGSMPVRDAHAIGHCVKAKLEESRTDVADVLIHLEPAPIKN